MLMMYIYSTTNMLNQKLISSIDISQSRGASTLFSPFLFGLSAIPSTDQHSNLLVAWFGSAHCILLSLTSALKLQVLHNGTWSSFHTALLFLNRLKVEKC